MKKPSAFPVFDGNCWIFVEDEYYIAVSLEQAFVRFSLMTFNSWLSLFGWFFAPFPFGLL